MKSAVLVAICGLALLSPGAAFAQISSAEQAMIASVDANYENSVSLLEKLVNQNSGTLNLAGVKAVADMLRPEFEALAFDVVWRPMAETGRAGHLIATHAGAPDSAHLLLIGHLDTVYERDSPFQTFDRKGEEATGPGAGDDKGGIVVILAALRAMQAAGTLANANIEVVLTGDEEDAGNPIEIARADLIAAGKRADVALDFEGLFIEKGLDMGSIARRSSTSWSLTTHGKTGHSSLIFNDEYGDGAIFELVRIVARMRADLPEPNLTFNVGLIAGGATASVDAAGVRASATGKTNIIPATAIARGDLRTLSEEQSARVQTRMQAIVGAHSAGTGAELVFEPGGYPAMAPTSGNRALLARLNEINQDLGLPAMPELDPLRRGAGDISFVAADVDGLAGLGTYSRGDHAPGETVDLSSIRRQAQRAAILMTRLSRSP